MNRVAAGQRWFINARNQAYVKLLAGELHGWVADGEGIRRFVGP